MSSTSGNKYTKRDFKIDLSKRVIQIHECKECKDWKHEKLWIGYKFCPYCGRMLNAYKQTFKR